MARTSSGIGEERQRKRGGTVLRGHIEAARRPFVLSFRGGSNYVLSSEEAQRLLDSYPAVKFSRYRVELRGDDGTRSVLQAATRGGGPAFTRG